MLKSLQIWICFVFIALGLNAQDIDSEENISRIIMPEVFISRLQPTGVFADNHSSGGIGLEGGVHFQLDVSHPYTLGILGSYHYFDSKSIEFVEKIEGIDIDLSENITTQILTVLGTFRYYPPILDSEVKIYTDLYFGPKIFFATYRLTDLDGGDYISEFNVEKSDVSMSYGLGLGLQIPLWRFIHLNVKASYLPGVSASYYHKIDPEVADPLYAIDAFELKNSSTNSLFFNIGVSFFL